MGSRKRAKSVEEKIDQIKKQIKTTSKVRPFEGEKSMHPWRLCPAGQHYRAEHLRHVPPSRKNPDGVTTVRAHCAANPTSKDQLYPEEIIEMSVRHFHPAAIKVFPNPNHLKFGADGTRYDILIAGWTQYWNEIFDPDDPLDPDLAKALIASESGFNPNPKKNRTAKGLMQIVEVTRKALSDTKGELRNHLIPLTRQELLDPNLNICAGIRWLFRKKEIAQSKAPQGRKATWDDAVFEYKSAIKNKNTMGPFRRKYHELKRGHEL